MIVVTFACGHQVQVSERQEEAPVCRLCPETRVARTTAQAPRFRGPCDSPFKVKE